jgi:predicted ester cyclase
MNIPSRDQRVTEMGMLLFRFQDGKIAEMWSALCDLELVQELGGLPEWRPPGTS